MDDTSMQALAEAYLLESTFAARNEIFARKADHEGRPQAARLFRAMAATQKVHANKALMLLRGKAESTEDNMAMALEDVEDAGTLFNQLQQEAKGAAQGFLDQFARTVRLHATLIGKSSESEAVSFHVCTVCGFLAENASPATCPVCHAVASKFEPLD